MCTVIADISSYKIMDCWISYFVFTTSLDNFLPINTYTSYVKKNFNSLTTYETLARVLYAHSYD